MTQKPLILAVETSGRTGSAALAIGKQILAETELFTPMKHSAEIFPAVCSLLDRFNRKSEEIEHIYISIGPGSFTGLRIATTLAKIMHLTNAVKIVAVDSLDCIAANVIDLTRETSSRKSQTTTYERIAVILDAKRSQFFVAVYEKQATNNEVWKKVFPDSLITASQFIDIFVDKDHPIQILGEGLVYYKDKFKAEGTEFFDKKHWLPKAKNVHLLGWEMALADQFANPLGLTPNYLRRPDAKVERKLIK